MIAHSALSKISNSLTRNFSYKLSDKNATTNFMKAASKEPIQLDEKQKCSILLSNVGSYVKTVFPLLNEWKTLKTISLETAEIQVINFVPGYEENGKHIDTLVTFLMNGSKVTVTCYNTTQKLKKKALDTLALFINICSNK